MLILSEPLSWWLNSNLSRLFLAKEMMEKTLYETIAPQLLARAKGQLTRRRARITKNRLLLMESIYTISSPYSTRDIIENIFSRHQIRIDPVTAYRNLELFCQAGLIHSLKQKGLFTTCLLGDQSEGIHILCHCHGCSHFSETLVSFKDADYLLQLTASQTGYTKQNLSIEVEGCCPRCQEPYPKRDHVYGHTAEP
jgi:Fe2+ or Zn2+ uptake regulation protein